MYQHHGLHMGFARRPSVPSFWFVNGEVYKRFIFFTSIIINYHVFVSINQLPMSQIINVDGFTWPKSWANMVGGLGLKMMIYLSSCQNQMFFFDDIGLVYPIAGLYNDIISINIIIYI